MIIVDDNNLDFSNDLITSLKGRGIDCGLFSSIGDGSVKSNDKIYLSVNSEDFDFKTDSKLVPFLKSHGFKKAALLILNAGNFEIEKHLNGALTVMKVPVLGKNGKAQVNFFLHYFIELVVQNFPNLPCSDAQSIKLTSLIKKPWNN